MPIHLQLTTPTHIIHPPRPFLAHRIHDTTSTHTYILDVPISAVFQHDLVTSEHAGLWMAVCPRPPQPLQPPQPFQLPQLPPSPHPRRRRDRSNTREPLSGSTGSREAAGAYEPEDTAGWRMVAGGAHGTHDAHDAAPAMEVTHTYHYSSHDPKPNRSPDPVPVEDPIEDTIEDPIEEPAILLPSPNLSISVPTVSIIMTTYNCAKYIEHAIRSLQVQTLTNWELVVVDDRSTDDLTDALLRELAQEDDRMVYLRNARNLGCYASKNIALEYVRGTWLTFHDADDYSMCERLEKQLQYCVGNSDTPVSRTPTTSPADRTPPHDCCYATSLARKQKTWTWIPITMFLRTQTFHEQLGSFDSVRFGADSEIRERMTSLGMRVGVVEDYLYACPDRWIELGGRTTSLTGDRKHDPIREHYRDAYLRFHHQVRRSVPLSQRHSLLRYPFPPAVHLSQIGAMEARAFVVEGVVGDSEAERLLYPQVEDIRVTMGVNRGGA